MNLIEMSIEEQLRLAMRWADELPEVKSEANLAHTSIAEAKTASSTKMKLAPKMSRTPNAAAGVDVVQESAEAVKRAAGVAAAVAASEAARHEEDAKAGS